jgi:hypothetical protein
VSDNDTPASGSRWEPPADAEGATPPPAEAPPSPTEPLASSAEPPADPVGVTRPGRRGGRAVLAAAGAGLILAGGIGGFAIGQATAGDGQGTEVSDAGSSIDADEDGFPDGPREGGRGGRPDFDGDDPGMTPGATVPDDVDPDDSGTSSGTGDDSDPA